MEDRNKLFRKAHGLLMKEGATKEEARSLVKETLRKGRPSKGNSGPGGSGSSGKCNNGGPGGQGGRTPPVVLIDDVCEGIFPAVQNVKFIGLPIISHSISLQY